MLDLLIRHATVIDGTGAIGYKADVGVMGECISHIAPAIDEVAKTEIDGRGLILSPGFIDVHSHDDLHLIKQPDCLAKISQGITTVIVGNCGLSGAPTVLTSSPVEPINLLGEQEEFCYPSVTHYIDKIKQVKPAVNVATLVGHSSLRNNVMQDLSRPANSDELAQMRQMLRQGMEAGALGLSTGLAYAPAFHASLDEVVALTQELTSFNGLHVTHVRCEFDDTIAAIDEALHISKVNKIPLHISHLKWAGKNNWGRVKELLSIIDSASEEQDISCDCHPYSAGSSVLMLEQVTDEIDIFITWSQGLPHHAGKLLSSIAQELDCSLMEAATQLQPAGAIYHNMLPDDVEQVLRHPATMIGSDGLPNDPHPHPRLWGAFPRVLSYYCGQRQLFSLEQAIHKMTAQSATRFKLERRGEIKVGAFADLVLFNPKIVKDRATFAKPCQLSVGIEKVFVNGELGYSAGDGVEQVSLNRSGTYICRSDSI